MILKVYIWTEFGNYIGGDLDSDDGSSDGEIAQASTSAAVNVQAQSGNIPADDDEDADGMEVDEDSRHMQLMSMDGVGTSQFMIHLSGFCH